jgi:dipeptidyl aminopeptidase/acylaminoacyl peptidase
MSVCSRRALFQASALSLGSALIGCGKKRAPGFWETPPLPDYEAGLFCDVNPKWAHDGKRIAFLRATPDRKHQLCVLEIATRTIQPLFKPELVYPDRPFHPGQDRYISPDTIAWSPDDARIAFPRAEWLEFPNGERLPGTGLWMAHLRSLRVSPLALHKKTTIGSYPFYRFPQWSPDGRRLAFVGEGIYGQRSIFLRALSVQNAFDVAPRPDAFLDSDWPVWEPSTRAKDLPALTHRQRIQRVAGAPPTETLRRIRPGSQDAADSGEFWRIGPEWKDGIPNAVWRIGHLAWSPDGEWLAFTLTPDANALSLYAIWVVRRDGGDARRISPQDGQGYLAPVWIQSQRVGALSPQKMAYQVVILERERERKTILGEIETADCDWSPDRRSIAYATRPTRRPPETTTTMRFFETGIV